MKDLIKFEGLDTIPALIQNGQDGLAKAAAAVTAFGEVTDVKKDKEAYALTQKLKNSMEARKAARMPITRTLDEVKKHFTSIENGLQVLITTMDAKRDAFAKSELEKQRRQEQEQALKLAQDQEVIGLGKVVINHLEELRNKLFLPVHNAIASLFDTLTEANKDEVISKLSGPAKWTSTCETYFNTPISYLPKHIDKNTAAKLLREKMDTAKEDFINSYLDIANTALADARDLVPIHLRDKEEANRIAKAHEQEKKEKAEREKQEAEKRIEAEQAIAVLDQDTITKSNAKEKMVIEVTENQAWLQIIAFWFEKDEKAKTADLSKKTFAQCLTFCEKYANDTGVIIEHPGITYTEKVKAGRVRKNEPMPID